MLCYLPSASVLVSGLHFVRQRWDPLPEGRRDAPMRSLTVLHFTQLSFRRTEMNRPITLLCCVCRRACPYSIFPARRLSQNWVWALCQLCLLCYCTFLFHALMVMWWTWEFVRSRLRALPSSTSFRIMKLCTVIVLGKDVLCIMQVLLKHVKLQMAVMGNFSVTFAWMAIKVNRIHIYFSASFTDKTVIPSST